MKFSLLVFVASILVVAAVTADTDTESCSVNGDDCGEAIEDKSSNFWKGDTGFSKDVLNSHLKDVGEEMNALEMEIIMSYLDGNKDNIVSQAEFKKVLNQRYDLIAQTAFDTFNSFDADLDALITLEEIQEKLGEHIDTEGLLLISLDIDAFPESKVDILSFFKPLIRLGKDISKVLTPFLQLHHLLPLESKKAIEGTLKMFTDIDTDGDGNLIKEEYLNSMNRPLPNGKTLTDEQKLAIFGTLDTNKDDKVSYLEFQVIMPQKQKDFTENLLAIFKETDINEDGFITEEELRAHLHTQSSLLKIPAPSEAEIEETFAKLDKDLDDKLSFEEMKALIEEFKKVQQARHSMAFKELDKDGNGHLSKDEIQEIVRIMEERSGQKIDPELLTKMLDKNDDGSVTFDEVQSLIQRFQPQD